MITIVDYEAGNLTSVQRALSALGCPSQVSADPDVILRAERIIFPGVGHAGSAMEVLHRRGLAAALKDAFHKGTPILGICLGCQVILSHCEEGNVDGLGLIPGECVRFQLSDPCLKVPHIGWNAVRVERPHPVLAHLKQGDEFYFVHSYYPQPVDSGNVLARCEHGIVFPAVIGYANLVAVQFHAEKSGPLGLKLLDNFSRWNGESL